MKREDCVQKIVKVAENNVELRYILYDKNSKEIVVDQYTEAYGAEKIAQDKAAAQDDYDYWNTLKPAEISAQKAEAQAKLTTLASIETAMAGPVTITP